jgi:hypothetical protein
VPWLHPIADGEFFYQLERKPGSNRLNNSAGSGYVGIGIFL